ncbi:hypothetical protein KCV07_g171, partial [Aureobasidium melanogenum]
MPSTTRIVLPTGNMASSFFWGASRAVFAALAEADAYFDKGGGVVVPLTNLSSTEDQSAESISLRHPVPVAAFQKHSVADVENEANTIAYANALLGLHLTAYASLFLSSPKAFSHSPSPTSSTTLLNTSFSSSKSINSANTSLKTFNTNCCNSTGNEVSLLLFWCSHFLAIRVLRMGALARVLWRCRC